MLKTKEQTSEFWSDAGTQRLSELVDQRLKAMDDRREALPRNGKKWSPTFNTPPRAK
jgi:hypothetical protein